jgi:hypothetical protein
MINGDNMSIEPNIAIWGGALLNGCLIRENIGLLVMWK